MKLLLPLILILALLGGCTPETSEPLQAPVVYMSKDGAEGYQPHLLIEDIPSQLTRFQPVKNRRPGFFPAQSVLWRDKLFFEANEADFNNELWVTDGTSDGTRLVKDINIRGRSNPSYLTPFQSHLYFRAYSADVGDELWRTDGTEPGTIRLVDVNDEPVLYPAYLTPFKNRLFFRAQAKDLGAELWVNNGTENGSRLFKDLFPGQGQGNPAHLTVVQNRLYFTATSQTKGTELWSSDGTVEGTAVAFDLTEGSDSSYPSSLTRFGDLLAFCARKGQEGFSLWIYDPFEGDPMEISLPADVIRKIPLKQFLVFQDGLYFTGRTKAGERVFAYNGTDVREIRALAEIGLQSIAGLFVAGDLLYVGGNSEAYGNELFVFDGKKARVIDFHPGPGSGLSVE